jgi:SPP1 gp7 family putative phage head morphogenesis protein
VRELVVEEDTFGLKTDLMFNARNQVSQRWRFKTSPQKLAEFQKWLEEQIDETVLDGGLPAEDAYWKAYVEEGYRKGAGRAFDDVRKAEAATAESLDFYAGTREEFLRSSFAAPETVEKVKGLAARTFTELKGVTSQVATQLNRELADGLTQGQNPRKIAARMAKKIDSLGKRRAETIARTEIIRAHAEGQLDTYDRLQKPTIKVMAEWSTAGDDRVCPLCLPLDGVVMKVKEARGTIPRHPNCRCSFMPANVGEPTKGQQRTPEQAKRAIAESIKREAPEGRSLDRQRELSKWVGADVKPTQRPKPFVAKGNK